MYDRVYFRKFVCSNTNQRVKLIPVSTAAGLKVPFSMALNSLLLQWSQQRTAVVILGSSQVWLCGAGWIWSRVVPKIKQQLPGPPHKYENKRKRDSSASREVAKQRGRMDRLKGCGWMGRWINWMKGLKDVGDSGREQWVGRWSDWLHTDALYNELSARPLFLFIMGNWLWQSKTMLRC